MAYCKHCGASNPENSKFCHRCGSAMTEEQEKAAQDPPFSSGSAAENTPKLNEVCAEVKQGISEAIRQEATERNDTLCPFCGEPACQPMQKNTAEVRTQNYRWGSGCCGLFLLGPFGLLCGLCGTGAKASVNSEWWWTCLKCGKQHIALEDALKKWDAAVSSLIGAGISGGLVFALFSWLELGFISLIAEIVALITPVTGLYTIGKQISQELGSPLFPYLSPERKKKAIQMTVLSTAAILGIGLFGVPLLEALLGA